MATMLCRHRTQMSTASFLIILSEIFLLSRTLRASRSAATRGVTCTAAITKGPSSRPSPIRRCRSIPKPRHLVAGLCQRWSSWWRTIPENGGRRNSTSLESHEHPYTEDLVVVIDRLPAGGTGWREIRGRDDLTSDSGGGAEDSLFEECVIEGHGKVPGEVIADADENGLDVAGRRVLVRLHEVVPAEEPHLLDNRDAVIAPELVAARLVEAGD